MKRIKDDFMDILEKQRIKPVFQPIVSMSDGKIIGYEALSRIAAPKEITSSEELFKLAGLYGKVWELEQLCRTKIVEKFHGFHVKDHRKLFINVDPMVIHDAKFQTGFTREILSSFSIDLSDVVYEVTERNAVDDIKGFRDTICHYKAQGYQIAVDDAGSCYSGLNLICDIVPHYLKLDMELIREINTDSVKRAMVKSLAEFANLTGILLIAEGIETAEELETLLRLGVHNGQGYFLGRPAEELQPVNPEALDMICRYQSRKRRQVAKAFKPTAEYRAILFSFSNDKSFNVYCEKYGDEAGDKLYALLEQIVMQNLSEGEHAIDMGEKGIIAVLNKDSCKPACDMIQSTFKSQAVQYYSAQDQKNDYMEALNSHNALKRYPFVSVCSERVV